MNFRYANKKKNSFPIYFFGTIFLLVFLFVSFFPKTFFSLLEKPLERAFENKEIVKKGTKTLLSSWYSNQKLSEENASLRAELDSNKEKISRTEFLESILSRYDVFLDEKMHPAHIVFWRSGLDQFMVNQGTADGISRGDVVFSQDFVALGYVTEIGEHLARVTLFSKNKEETQSISFPQDHVFSLVGRGSGSFELDVPRDFEIQEGDTFYTLFDPGAILARVQKVEFDSRDPYKKVFLSVPTNLKTGSIVGIKNTQNAFLLPEERF
ncbi:MAG: rod shape-determining protein MreC [Candidatus Pacebacteria bacterium]|nr:rod shape-determining protein MreC [Candidatus Paceibacterota bacterium]